MWEGQAAGKQGDGRKAVVRAVSSVPRNRVSDVRELRADLMRPTGIEANGDERKRATVKFCRIQHAVGEPGGLRAGRILFGDAGDPPFFVAKKIIDQGTVRFGKHAVYDRQILLVKGVFFPRNERREYARRPLVRGDGDQSPDAAIKAMDRIDRTPDLARKKREKIGITAPVGLGEQSRGFVHDDHVAVPEQDVV